MLFSGPTVCDPVWLMLPSLSEFQFHSQDLIVAQGFSGWSAIPTAVWDVPVGSDNVKSIIDEVVLQDAVVGCAGGQRGRGINLMGTCIKEKTFTYEGIPRA